MARETLAEWFGRNPDALKAAKDWKHARDAGAAAESSRRFVARLREEHGYPFRAHISLLEWVEKGCPTAIRVPKPREKRPRQVLDDFHFGRGRAERKRLEARGTFVVTCAQNNTEPDRDFLRALLGYCKERGAELLVIPIRYKNPTNRRDPSEDADGEYWWHSELLPYLVEDELRVHPYLRIMANVRIQATAARPLTGLDSRSAGASAIYGHPQLSMRTIATPQNELPKILYTTGAVTRKNYSRTKAGDLGAFHHTHAAVVAEVRGKRFHLREVTWDGGKFHDLDRVYMPRRSKAAPRVAALVTGDEHVWFNCPDVRRATYTGKDSICAALRPRVIVRHDLFDCYSVSPHHRGNSITRAVKAANGWDSLERELGDTLRFVEETTPRGAENVIVSANHHDQLLRWLQTGEAHVDPRNAELYHWMKWRILAEAELGASGVKHPDPLELYARGRLKAPARFLGTDESYQVHGVELGMHGHLGPNGARGSLVSLSKIGTRSIVGHSHSPGIEKGAYQVGTSSNLRLEYNSGPSSWLNTHAVVHANGKRQMIHVISGKWRG